MRLGKRNDYFMSHSKRMAALGPDKNELFVLRTCAVYLDRLLACFQIVDSETIKLLTWVLGPEVTAMGEHLLNSMNQKEKRKFAADLAEYILDPDEAPDVIYRIVRQAGKRRISGFVAFSRNLIERQHRSLSYSGSSETEKKILTLAKMFNLTDQEKEFCTFLYIISTWRQGEDYFVDHLRCQDISGRRYLKIVMQMSDREVNVVLSGTLSRIDFYEMDRHSFALTDDFMGYFQKPSAQLLAKNYFTHVSRKTIPLESHLIAPKETEHILQLLSMKRESPNHILLYGPPGTGKTSYALGLAKKLGIPTYEILRDDENTTSKRRAAILACLNMTNGGNGSLVIVDEADNLLNTQNSWFIRGETQDKGWLNQLLEEAGARMIWITNEILGIEGSVLRRFAFSIHFRSFNQRQRIGIWQSVLRRHRAKRFFSFAELKALSSRYAVSAAVVDMAVMKALETSPSSHESLKEAVTMNLGAHMTLLNGGEKVGHKEKIEDSYTIEGLNVEGDLPTVMEQLKKFDRCLRQSDHDVARNFNLLFYGPPGSGKSELARYIAKHLDREYMVRRTSDIVSPFVGETEQNISHAFSEAETAEAVLIIDEADSFFYDRSRAVRSWEISHTNEFLTQMERFRGILICTTNRFTDLDSASIRRFNHKIGFRYLNPEGNVIFFKKLCSPLAMMPVPVPMENDLRNITDLTPGDFRIVRDRYVIYPPGEVTHEMLLKALQEESQIKKVQGGRKQIGF